MLTKLPPPPPNRHAVLASRPAPKFWRDVLADCGYPTSVLVIDFETYFDDNMPESTVEYIRCPEFEVVSCCFTLIQQPHAEADQHTLFVAGEEAVAKHLKYLQGQFGDNLGSLTVVAQNATFDASILAFRYGIHPSFLIDLLGLARHQNARQKNDLASLCTQYKLPAKGDTSQFKGLTFRNRFKKAKGRKKGPKLPVQVPKFTDAQVAALADYNRNDNLREWDLFTILLPKLSNPQTELRVMQHTLELFTKPMLLVDFAKGNELVAAMDAEIDKVIPPGLERPVISGDKSFENVLVAALEEAGDNPQRYYKPCKRGMMLALAKPDPERELLLNHTSERVRAVMAARVALDSWPLHISRVNRIMAQAKANGGVLPVPLKYHGAHTGRDSGGEKINLQNLGSRGHDLVSEVRNLLVAPPGMLLVIVDASAVEARGLAWIAGQWDLVEKFANGEEIYCGFASKVLGYPVRKPRKSGGIPAIERRMAWARNSVGKIGILGCGYGMGGDKAEGYAGGAIDNATAHRIVETYRKEHPEIVKFWRDLEKAFVYTAKYRKPCELPRGLRFDSDSDCDVILTLPNGRELHYPTVKLVADDRGDKIELYNAMEHHWEHTWGGSLTENVVQALCRDLLMEAMLRLADLGHRTVHRVHDELVLCVPADQAESVLKLAVQEMSRTPAWAPRLALGAEGIVSERYGKH